LGELISQQITDAPSACEWRYYANGRLEFGAFSAIRILSTQRAVERQPAISNIVATDHRPERLATTSHVNLEVALAGVMNRTGTRDSPCGAPSRTSAIASRSAVKVALRIATITSHLTFSSLGEKVAERR
jgi:hypothetical protein